MRAGALMEDYPSVDVSAPAADAVRMIGIEGRPAVLVLSDGRPRTVLPGSQVLNFLIPGYLQEDPSLVKVYGEDAANHCAARLEGRTVGDLLPAHRRVELPAVAPTATLMECAAVMAKLHSPLLVVVSDDGAVVGAITASRLLGALIA
ncbi:MAG TPA: CBS domain-containing protein [Nocardioides sp.]|uniref:CBS domain-containing protein n=1 Tax=Nocardioides sp. TaxID=35761 RepID=UPI002C365D9E|nr:CBS domain-containing protein [Nocardioides sp.]HQR27333.1 CBS domain-containing protein [Nocardioides sp.]